MANQWFEKLPQSCPPSDAKVCEGTFYRVSHGNPAESKDFFSQQLLAPEKKFNLKSATNMGKGDFCRR